MAMLVYPAKLVAAVVVAFVSLGATLWSSVAEPDSYYPRIVAGSAKPTVSMDAKGAVAPDWDRDARVLLDIVQTRLDLLNAIESTSASPMDCHTAKSNLCVKMDEARRDGLTAWEHLTKKMVDWKASGGTVATPVHDAMIHLRASIPKLGKSHD